MSIFLYVLLNFTLNLRAQDNSDPIFRDCRVVQQNTGNLRGSKICRQELNCMVVNRQAGTHAIVEKTAYCPARSDNSLCPIGDECLADRSVTKNDVMLIEFKRIIEERQNELRSDCLPVSVKPDQRNQRHAN